MKLSRLFLMVFTALTATTSAATISVTGVDDNGSGGVYNIDGVNYWWMCVEPGPPAVQVPTLGQTITADSQSFLDGWDQQNQERLDLYTADPSLYTTAIPRQVAVMEYVLDTYLPWSTLAGASGRFIEQSSDSSLYVNDDAFYNSFFAVQNFLSETYGKTVKVDFTNLGDYVEYYNGNFTPAGIARSGIFQSILTDVAGKGNAFFDSYTATHGYFIANTLFPSADPDNWQDALVIASFAPVPEPGGALLIATCGIAWMIRRRRLLA